MKICYIISTCDKYFQTRVKYQMEFMLKNIKTDFLAYQVAKSNFPHHVNSLIMNIFDDVLEVLL